MGRTFSAQEMVDCGFVSRILPTEGFRETVLDLAANAAKFSGEALKVTKDLIRGVERDLLEQVNQKEMNALGERMASSDSLESIMRFLGKTCVSLQLHGIHYICMYVEESAAKKAAKKAKL
jgi:peroxisomal 3,2-trans-enoyl-CoA isomerase